MANAVRNITNQLYRLSIRKNLPICSQYLFKGHRIVQLPIRFGTRSLCTAHTLRTPEVTSQNFSDKFNPRYAQEDEEDEYEIDDDELEKLRQQHREEARTQHKAKEGITFADYPVNPVLLKQLGALGYKEPFVIQSETLRHTLSGRDVIAKAVTGSGKTLCFGIPIVHKIAERPRNGKSRNPRAIVISPTRELCLQIHRCVQELDPRVKCVATYGGERIERQEYKIMKGCDVICATPGRLNDLLKRGLFGLGEVEFLCLDEADELLTPNFKEQIEDVLEGCPEERQMMMFSATIPKHIRSLTEAYMRDPEIVDITKDQKFAGSQSVQHKCIECTPKDMVPVLVTLLKEHSPQRCIVFMETKRLTKDVATDLTRCGAKAHYINSDLSQNRRENLMAAFRQGKLRILVATDVAARGLDIPEIDLIIQVKPPTNGTDYYVHRSGRTGRAGRDGLAIMLHSGTPEEMAIVREIEGMVNLEHVPPPDVAYLENAQFRTFVPYGFSGRQGGQPRRSSFGYGRGRPRFSRGFDSFDRRDRDFSSERRYGSRYSSRDDEFFSDRRYGSRYGSREDRDFSSFSDRRRKSYDYDDFS